MMQQSPQPAENKMAAKPVFPLLMSMALPPMLSMLIQSLYNIVDSVFVARYSQDALTAVSLAFPLQNLILAVAVGTGVGVNSYIARKLGEHRQKEANQAAAHGILLALLSAVVFVILGALFIPPFFRLYTADPEVFRMGCEYSYIVVFFCFGTLVHIAIEKILQATGKMLYPMALQAIGAIINIVLDPLFIFGGAGIPAMGVRGAAIATIIGQITSMSLSLLVLHLQKHDVSPDWKHFRFNPHMAGQIYAVGVPTILINSLSSVLVMGLNAILSSLSKLAVPVFGVYFKLQTFVFMPVSGLSQGAMPIMGYNYGARSRKRLLSALKASLLVALALMAAGTAVFLFFPGPLLLLFDATPEMLGIGIPALRIICLSYLPAAVGLVFTTLFQAMGKGFASLLISLLRQLIVTLPAALLFSHFWGLAGVWFSFPLSELLAAVFSAVLFFFVYRRAEIFRRTEEPTPKPAL